MITLVRCPCCGHVFNPDASPLSADARALLDRAPHGWLRGERASIQVLADLGGMSYRRARQALLELAGAGYVARVPYGRRGRTRYVAVPTMLARQATRAA